MFNPKYKLTDKILRDLTAIAEAKGVIDRAKILPKHELRLRRQAIIRMTHHSTEIEYIASPSIGIKIYPGIKPLH